MKLKYSNREEAIGTLKYMLERKFKTHRYKIKPKLFGFIYHYYKHPHESKSLWVTAEVPKIRGVN